MGHVEVGHDASPSAELGEAPAGHVVAHHAGVVGQRDEERALVGVALAEDGVDLERGPARVRQVDGVAVVHHALEDGERPYPHGVEEHATALAAAIEAARPGWVEASVVRLLHAWQGSPPSAAQLAEVRIAGERAAREVGDRVAALLAQDVDEQRETPLTVLRAAVRYPTEVLRAHGVPEVVRDEFRERAFPDDVYDLAPATWADVSPDLAAPGMAWGAWKAMTVKRRRAT